MIIILLISRISSAERSSSSKHIFPSLILGSIVTAHRYKMQKSDHALIRRAIREKHETGDVSLTDEEKQICARIAGLRWEDMWIGQPQPQTVGAEE